MNYGRRLTLSCGWPGGLDLNSGAPPPERRDVVGSDCLYTVMSGIKLGPWIVGFYPLTTSQSNRSRHAAHSELGPWLLAYLTHKIVR